MNTHKVLVVSLLALGIQTLHAQTVRVVPKDGSPSFEITNEAAMEIARKAREGRTKGNLGAMRAALAIYYGDKEGRYPADTAELVPVYMRRIPVIILPGTGHEPSSEVIILRESLKNEEELFSRLTDSGKWLYVSFSDSTMDGMFIIDCTHQDSKGTAWHTY